MTHWLYKPHVVGPENNVTTPDIVVDRAVLLRSKRSDFVPVHRLTSAAEIQVATESLIVAPACSVIAAGGGALISPSIVLQTGEESGQATDVLVARAAWRLHNLLEHIDRVEMVLRVGDEATSHRLSEFDIAKDATGIANLRGVAGVYSVPSVAVPTNAQTELLLQFADPVMERRVSHSVTLIPISAARWDGWPSPRYTVGPTGDVKHYI